ncbi:hypothetical protein OEZ85_012902 [Tetradesmus obliquus]|uniref:Phenazine biosynthesis-like domain-containing protein n=1 Tax=Tetradesmus obliquus TaxID=3088 RepID=A0ABY8U509_TETOB|nr:hypothetical protein OEZ85_012902 [Tetradesmus obliquus]
MPRLTLRKVNAFTTCGVAATGNPAAVCLLDAALLGSMPDSLRQSIAADIGLSETAYVEPLDPSSSPGPDVFKQLNTFRLRWFTPAAEVPLCGHATLASAATLFTECGNPAPTLHFHTLSGILQGLEALAPDAAALEAAGSPEFMGGLIISTLPSTGEEGGYDFHSRFFGPWLGVPEDPVTGSAHAVLAPYYAAVLRKQQLFARQCSARGGDVWMDAGAQPGRVLVSGEAAMEQTWEAEY